jgi:hypothetical protein
MQVNGHDDSGTRADGGGKSSGIHAARGRIDVDEADDATGLLDSRRRCHGGQRAGDDLIAGRKSGGTQRDGDRRCPGIESHGMRRDGGCGELPNMNRLRSKTPAMACMISLRTASNRRLGSAWEIIRLPSRHRLVRGCPFCRSPQSTRYSIGVSIWGDNVIKRREGNDCLRRHGSSFRRPIPY